MPRTLFILLILLLAILPAAAQDTPINPDLQAQIDLIERNTETLRGLTALVDVPVRFPTRDELGNYLAGEITTHYTAEQIAEDMAFYVAFDFLPPNYDIQGELLSLYEQQVAGYYDPTTATMNVILTSGEQPDTFIPLLDRIVYSHEYVHALQDQYFDLKAYQDTIETSPNLDSSLALQALVEGDASHVMNEYAARAAQANPLGAILQIGLGAVQTGNLFLPADTPKIFESEVLFSYISGERFVGALIADGGWDRVNDAYTMPPQSTEHIIHPRTFLSGDNPIAVELPVTLPGDDWEVARSGVLGEFYLRNWLDTQLSDEAIISSAAAGWGGDFYHIYRSSEGELAWKLRLVWDTPQDAQEFMMVLQDFIALRLPDSTRSLDGVACWSGRPAMCVTKVDDSTLDITFAPTLELVMQLAP